MRYYKGGISYTEIINLPIPELYNLHECAQYYNEQDKKEYERRSK